MHRDRRRCGQSRSRTEQAHAAKNRTPVNRTQFNCCHSHAFPQDSISVPPGAGTDPISESDEADGGDVVNYRARVAKT
jgi:hypothetical protein